MGAYANGSRTYLEAYRETGQEWQPRWDVGLSAAGSKDFGRRMRLGASGSVAYSPYLSFDSFDFSSGGVGNLPITGAGLDYVLARDPNVTTSAAASLSYALDRRSSIEAYYDTRYQTFVASEPLNPDRSDELLGARYRYRFSRFFGARAGYGYRRASFHDLSGSAPNVANHYLDVGVDAGYGRSYALTRRTTFSFSTDSSLFVEDDFAGDPNAGNGTETRLFVGGLADLTHTLGRSWAARVGYRRGVDYEVGFVQPLLSDTGHASIGGLLTRRLDFSATAYYTAGTVGFSGSDNNYTNSSAVAALRFALSRHLAAYAQYFYYHYDYGRGVTLPGYLQSDLDRQGASVGLTALVPLIGARGSR